MTTKISLIVIGIILLAFSIISAINESLLLHLGSAGLVSMYIGFIGVRLWKQSKHTKEQQFKNL